MIMFAYIREPPPNPEETTAPEPLNDHMLNIPYKPSLGSQKLFLISKDARGNECGGYAFPRSNRHTRKPASASLKARTEPPKPDPTITASKCSSLILSPCYCFFLRAAAMACSASGIMTAYPFAFG